jgi:iron complex outermembrane receptor protein
MARRLALYLAASAATAAVGSGAWAQTAAPADNAVQLQELVVTGSRIPRPNLDQPTPVSVISSQQIQDYGRADLGAVLAQLPALGFDGTVRGTANGDGAGNTAAAGLNQPDLRNLGVQRTLTLVDGQRHVGGDVGNGAAVDFNAIPAALVDHVEVTTGGASAVYGSDAVSGVINVILKQRFVGVEASAQYGASPDGGWGASQSAYLTVGQNFAQDRGNAVVTLFYDHSNAIRANDIKALNNQGQVTNPADICPPSRVGPTGQACTNVGSPIPNDGIPDRLLVSNVVSEMLGPNGALVGLGAKGRVPLTLFDAAGNPVAVPARTASNSAIFGSFAQPCPDCFSPQDYIDLQPRTDRKGVATNWSYDLTPNVKFTFDGKYVSTTIVDDFQPAFELFGMPLNTLGVPASSNLLLLRPDNAFLTPAIRAAIAPAAGDLIFINRLNTDFGDHGDTITRQTERVVAGLSGDVDAPFAAVHWDANANFGETDNRYVEHNIRLDGNFQAAIDSVLDPVTHQPACRINAVPGTPLPANLVGPASACIPYNPFGQQNSAAALAYVRGDGHDSAQLTQMVINANFRFDSSRFFNLPGGPASFAGGVEARKEGASSTTDPLEASGATEAPATPSSTGSFDVAEAYLETSLPVIKHRPLIEELTIDGAVRQAHYDPFGDATTWKVAGVYAPFPRDIGGWLTPLGGLKFRGSYGVAVRAPNITEAFQPAQGTFFNVADPCSTALINTNANFKANCAAQGVPAGFASNSGASIAGVTSGNTGLTPETSRSYTVGLIYQPSWLPRFSFTADYYNYDIANAITALSAQDVVTDCLGAPGGPDQAFCKLFTRDPATHNINFVQTTYLNAASEQTHGVDFQVNYATDIGGLTQHWAPISALNGRLSASATVGWLMALRVAPFQDQPQVQHVLEGTDAQAPGSDYPTTKSLFDVSYQQGPLTIDWQARYISRAALYIRDAGQADYCEAISPCQVPAQWYHNVALHYDLPTGHFARAELFGGVDNLFDQEPPDGVITQTANGAGYDLGRYAYVGIKVRE